MASRLLSVAALLRALALTRGHASWLDGVYSWEAPELRPANYDPLDVMHQSAEAMAAVTDLHVVFSNHLDLGFNVRAWCDGPDGCTSAEPTKTGLPCRPWAYWVLNENINVFLPRAAATAAAMGNGTDRYIYMTQPWVASFYTYCENTGLKDWRNPAGGNGPDIIECPNKTAIAMFKQAVTAGNIFFQAFPHNAQPGTYDASLFEASLDQAAHLADVLGAPRPGTFSQRDETGMTRAILPLLKKHNVTMISLGSGGSSGGHPRIPDLFVWRDEASDSEVVFTFDHGYGGGTHILPNGHALYCAWNTDNGGPQTPESATRQFAELRKKYPNAKVFASTFDDFSAIAHTVKDQLPVVTSEIGDTWLYGVPSDPLKNVWFREFSRKRRACVAARKCDPTDPTFRNFDRLMTKIPEHTWGEDTTWYLHDYDNWTNTQINSAMMQDNYNMTVESWREQRSYLVNAPGVLKADPKYAAFGTELEAAITAIAKLTEVPDTAGLTRAKTVTQKFTCKGNGASVRFGADGAISSLVTTAGRDWASTAHPLGRFTYQSLSAENFTTFCADYGNEGCSATTENPGCHNFHKPNMSSAHPAYHEMVPKIAAVFASADECRFAVRSVLVPANDGVAYGSPEEIWTLVDLAAVPKVSPAGASNRKAGAVTADITVTWINKTTTRLAEASWVSFDPVVAEPGTGWAISSLDTVVDPTDVVQHGAVHLHSMGPDGAMLYKGTDGEISIASLDAPVVSCGVLSPFPTPGDNTTLKINMANGMLWNVQNNIWNTNYPQWYPFEGVYGYGSQTASLGANAAFRFELTVM